MRVLILHNRYQQRGGEDAVVAAEVELLRSRGVNVVESYWTNDCPGSLPVLGALELAARSAWSRDSYRAVLELCRRHRPDVVHVHNFWMRLSPSAHAAGRVMGAATVQTIHNHRLLCANALLVRDGALCGDCLGKTPWAGVMRRCYRGSAAASAAVVRMIETNRRRKTWQKDVDAFIFPSASTRDLHLAGGLPPDRLFVKPHFVCDPGPPPLAPSASGDVLFVGRLSPEKGVNVLLEAWRTLERNPGRRLVIVGDGPLRAELERLAAGLAGVQLVGLQNEEGVRRRIARARAVVVPSLAPETFGRVVIESYASGRPVIASAIGAFSGLIRQGVTGLRVPAGNPGDLARALELVLSSDSLADRLGQAARSEYTNEYAPDRNFNSLMGIYHAAMNRKAAHVEAMCTP